MDLLPPPQERPWLLEQLADLMERAGQARFFTGPLLEPDAEGLPEPDTADAAEAALSTLIAHAGLGELERQVERYADEAAVDPESLAAESLRWRHPGAAVWFAGVSDDGALVFGLLEDELAEAQPLTPRLCHEVVHAWRDHEGLTVGDDDLEELLTDLSAVYLGLGLVACQEPVRPNQGKVVELGVARKRRASALKPQAMAYLLGAQLVLRDIGPRERSRLLRALPRVRREMVKAAVADLSRPGRLEELRSEEEEDMGKVVRLPVPTRAVRRVESNQLLVGLGKGLVLGAILGFFSLRILGPLSSILLFVIGGAIGANLGRSTKSLYCSGCGTELDANDAVCPGCDSVIRG